MHVSSKSIIEKMEAELRKAKAEGADRESLLRHVANIKVLCELLLDESTDGKKEADPTLANPSLAEIKKMMGTSSVQTDEEIKHDPTSIFDF